MSNILNNKDECTTKIGCAGKNFDDKTITVDLVSQCMEKLNTGKTPATSTSHNTEVPHQRCSPSMPVSCRDRASDRRHNYVVNAADLRTTTPGNRIAKYADDTYLIIPACNFHSRANELDNVDAWAKVNNLRLNRHKSLEIVVTDGRRRRLVDPPPTLHDVSRVTSVKILRVTFTCKLSLSEHVSVIVSACAPS